MYCCLVTKSCLTLCDLPGSSVQGISQARILEWGYHLLQRSSRPRERACIPCIGRQILYLWATKGAPSFMYIIWNFYIERYIFFYILKLKTKRHSTREILIGTHSEEYVYYSLSYPFPNSVLVGFPGLLKTFSRSSVLLTLYFFSITSFHSLTFSP